MTPVEFRRHLHRHPELSFRETESARFIAEALREAGIPCRPIAGTGVLAKIEGRGDLRRAVVLRADIDALPIREQSGAAWSSENDGVMHACGHDAHTALGLAVARWIMENRKRLTGVIKLIFQPAEEGVRGANAIVGSGFVDDVDVILASHCGGAIKSMQIGLVYDGLLAST